MKSRGLEQFVKTAILVDGDFFLKRYKVVEPRGKKSTPLEVAKYLNTMAHRHIENQYLYRIFYYDCLPFEKKLHNPCTKKVINFSETEQAKFRYELFENFKKLRKFALRIGYLKDNPRFPWTIRKEKLRDLIEYETKIQPQPPQGQAPSDIIKQKGNISEEDFIPDLRQKGVDIRIGVDIASLAYKRLVNRMILISGDSDFVPAAKIARREGIDFILDPMWNHVSPDLFEHIDGLHSVCPKPKCK